MIGMYAERAGAKATIRSPIVLTAPLTELSPPVNALAIITIPIATAKVRRTGTRAGGTSCASTRAGAARRRRTP